MSVLVFLSEIPALRAQPLKDDKGYALVFPRKGEGFAANVLRSEPDSLVLFTNDFKYVAKKDIAKIVFHSHRRADKGFWTGSILGVYASNMIFGTATGQPGPFLSTSIYGDGYSAGQDRNGVVFSNSSSPLSSVGIVLAGVLAGGGFGWLLERRDESSITYEFSEDSLVAMHEWEDFDRSLLVPRPSRPFRLSLTGASVFATMARAYRRQAIDAGLTVNNYTTFGSATTFVDFAPFGAPISVDPVAQDASDFNWGRTLAFSYRLLPEFEVGAAWTWLSEPTFGAYYGQILASPPDPFVTELRTFTERLNAHGFYATASVVRAISLFSPSDFEVRATAGLGLAKVNFEARGKLEIDSESIPVLVHEYNTSIHKFYFSAMGSLEFSYYLYDLLSLGLEASYYYAGSTTAAEMPYLLIKEQPVSFGNADIGFTIAVHF